jgi:hypothetical protein
VIFSEVHAIQVSEKRVVEKNIWTEVGESCTSIMRILITFYSSQKVAIKTRYVAQIREDSYVLGFGEKARRKVISLKNLDVASSVIFKRVLGNRMEEYGLNSCGLGQGVVDGSCVHGNEPSGSIKCKEIHE